MSRREADARDAIAADQWARDRITLHGLDEGLFVEAGAGTGKTTQLVGRLLGLVVERGVLLREIAAITFTEAAAVELRDRVRERLERRAATDPDQDVRDRCHAALADADIAAISTLHSFAQRILSEHPIEGGLPPRVEVLDEVRSQLEFERRWEEFVDRLLVDPANEPALTRAVTLGIRIDGGRAASLRDVAVIFGENWDRLDSIAGEPECLRPLERAAAVRAVGALPGLEASCTNPDDLLAAHLREVASSIEAVERALDALDDQALVRVLIRKGKWASKRGRGTAWPDVGSVRDALARADAACQALRDAAADDVLRALAARLARFTIAAADERRRDGRLEFHDLLVLARRLLRTSADARHVLHDRYRRLLLDEFQDTDPIQIELAVLIAASVGGTPGEIKAPWPEILTEPERLFFVGDPKQSIYRFRRADIQLFLEARDRFAGQDTVRLSRNFRTVETVLEWVNRVFGAVMPDEVEGSRPRYEPLVADRADGVVGDHRVVLIGGPYESADAPRADQLRALEADDVAAAVAEILRAPERWPVSDPGSSEWRAPRGDDIAILVPTRTSLGALQSALDAHHVPHRTETGSLVYETQEVRDLLAIVRAVVDPTDALALVAALRSPAFACGDDDLFEFRHAGGRWDLRAHTPEDLPATQPVVAAIAYLGALHEARWWMEPSALVDRIIRERRLFELAFARRRPRDVWRRLRFVLDQARLFSEAQAGDLVDFLAWAELQRRDSSRVQEPLLPEADDDAVRILTIHGAKGLEFPITVVSGLTTAHRNRGRGVGVEWDADGRVELRMGKSLRTERFERLASFEAEMDRYEKERLLYVAVTRARDYLLVATHHKAGATCFAATLWEHSQAVLGSLCRPNVASPDRGLGTTDDQQTAPPAPAPEDTAEVRVAWARARAALLTSQAASRSTSPTAIARAAAAVGTAEPDLAPAADDLAADQIAPDEPFPWRRGRAGTAIGRAVHSVLQSVDLATGEGVEALATAAAQLEAIPERAHAVARLARAALECKTVLAAAALPHWREAYVAAPVGGRMIEGYVDLLVRRPDGIIVVDYKTDSVRSPAEADARLEHYRLQGAAYAVALEESTGLPVVECIFVFTHPGGAIERSVADLPAAMIEVRARLETAGAGV